MKKEKTKDETYNEQKQSRQTEKKITGRIPDKEIKTKCSYCKDKRMGRSYMYMYSKESRRGSESWKYEKLECTRQQRNYALPIN